jgi:hypothetical protein
MQIYVYLCVHECVCVNVYVCASIMNLYAYKLEIRLYLRFKLIYLINLNDKFLIIISKDLQKKINNHDIYFV